MFLVRTCPRRRSFGVFFNSWMILVKGNDSRVARGRQKVEAANPSSKLLVTSKLLYYVESSIVRSFS
jgi:hypothetical protein